MQLNRKLRIKVIETGYWLPGTDLTRTIRGLVEGQVADGDALFISEKALSTALGNVIDERDFKPTWLAKAFVKIWMRTFWPLVLGRVCRLRRTTLSRVRRYPVYLGARHKLVALRYAGFLEALKHFSEGGIDATNLPYSYVSLPLKDPARIANLIFNCLGAKVKVVILDGDSTFKIGGAYFSTRRSYVRGVHHLDGPLIFLLGRALGAREFPTPIAIAGGDIELGKLFKISRAVAKAMRGEAGGTAWDMAKKFRTDLDKVTWKMLTSIKHKPIVIVRGLS